MKQKVNLVVIGSIVSDTIISPVEVNIDSSLLPPPINSIKGETTIYALANISDFDITDA